MSEMWMVSFEFPAGRELDPAAFESMCLDAGFDPEYPVLGPHTLPERPAMVYSQSMPIEEWSASCWRAWISGVLA